MAPLPNSRHERFAQLIAQGHSIVDAHEQAGYARNDSNSAQLAKRPEIKARITEINGRAAKRAEITLETLLDEAGDAQARAIASGALNAEIAALKLKAELSGFYVQRKQDVTPRRSSREIEAELRAILADGETGEDSSASAGVEGSDPLREALSTLPTRGTA